MQSNRIKNVVFDVGNVLVRWNPMEIVRLTFGDSDEVEELATSIFQNKLWLSLNKGEMSERTAIEQFQNHFNFNEEVAEQLFYYVKNTQILLFGTSQLLNNVKTAGYKVYALTDNVTEIVDYLKEKYDFWHLFDGTIVSAEVGCLKPHSEIFSHLLNQYEIQAFESVFIDDVIQNIEGAQQLGFSTVHFKNSLQCEKELMSLGLVF